jgi:hypothetical protein
MVFVMVVAAVAGATAAQASLAVEGQEPVRIFWALGGLLGIQTLLLLFWVGVMWKGPAAMSGASLGGAVVALGRRVASRTHSGAVHAAAVEATGVVFGRGSIGRWTFGAITHGLWVSFNTMCLLLVVLMLSTRHYTFTWETTILSAGTYRQLTRAWAFLPDAAGFPTPTARQIAEAEWPLDPSAAEEARGAWSGLLVGSLVLYGLAPRLLLLAFCLDRRRGARHRFRLDLTRPGYLRLQARLMPQSAWLGVVDGAPGEEDLKTAARSARRDPTAAGDGPPAIVGLEIEAPASAWPPRINGTSLRDLGFVDGRDDRRRVVDALASLSREPAMVVVVCSLATTPDRGIASFLDAVQRAVRSPVSLVLSGGQSLRRRGNGEQVRLRVDDWRQLADSAGLPPDRVIELDLDHLTESSQGKLAALLGAVPSAPAQSRRIESAFELIIDHLGRWPDAPDLEQQAELHRTIGTLYRPEHASWRSFLRAPVELKADLTAPLRAGADRVVKLLPEKLRSSPRWLASGALAGALGCVAAATLVTPVAIASLPLWTVVGAAVAAVTGASLPAAGAVEEDDDRRQASRSDAVRAAVLFALLLELQGRDEATITRVLDRVVDPDDVLETATASSARAALDGIRHRLDLALAVETAR